MKSSKCSNRAATVHRATERKAWYKIAPPAGEFRWVSGRYVDPDHEPGGGRRTAGGGAVDLTGQTTGRLAGRQRPRRLPAKFQRQLDQIDLELSAMIVEDPNFWELRLVQATGARRSSTSRRRPRNGARQNAGKQDHEFRGDQPNRPSPPPGRNSPGRISRPSASCRLPIRTAASTPRAS